MRAFLYVLLIAGAAVLLWLSDGQAPEDPAVPPPAQPAPVELKVVDEHGAPVFRARVRYGAGDVDPAERKNRTRTDAEGLATTPPLAGRVHLFASAPGHAAARHTVERGAAPDGPVVVALREAAALEGRVVDGQGNPVVGARLWLVGRTPADDAYGDPDWIGVLEATSGEGGRFRLEAVPTGTLLDLKVEAAHHRPFSVKVGVPSPPFDIRIERLPE